MLNMQDHALQLLTTAVQYAALTAAGVLVFARLVASAVADKLVRRV
jgi:hypothetical protein